mgnify:CR=1 FL=1
MAVRESGLTSFFRNGERVLGLFFSDIVIWSRCDPYRSVITYFHLYVDILQVMEADEGAAWYTSGLQHSVYSD